MPRQKKEIPFLSQKKEIIKKEKKVAKDVILWTIHNLKYLILPKSHLDDVIKSRYNQELIIPKKHGHKWNLSPLFIIGVIAVMIISTIAIFPEWISPYTYIEARTYTGIEMYYQSYSPPSPEHPLGQTFAGFDILARIIYGARPVLIFATTSTLIACLLGILIGALSGYFEGWFDVIVMRIMDIVLSFPGVIFAIVFITIWGKSFVYLIIIYSLIGMPYFARLVRSSVLKEKLVPYVASGRVAGAKNFRIIFKHILPNCSLPLIIAASFNIGRNILSLAVLGFLRYGGVGWIEWGYDIALAINNFYIAPWAVLWPSLMISISVVGFLLIGDGLADANLISRESL